jgi:hypothetical protein
MRFRLIQVSLYLILKLCGNLLFIPSCICVCNICLHSAKTLLVHSKAVKILGTRQSIWCCEVYLPCAQTFWVNTRWAGHQKMKSSKGQYKTGAILLKFAALHLRTMKTSDIILIIGLCILLRVYQLNTGRTSVRNKVLLSINVKFYCALLTLHVSAPFRGHLQVVRKHKNISKAVTTYSTDPLRYTY